MPTITYPSMEQFPSTTVFTTPVNLKAADTGIQYQNMGGTWEPTPAANFSKTVQSLNGGFRG